MRPSADAIQYNELRLRLALLSATGSAVYSEFYHFNTVQTGLILSIPLTLAVFWAKLVQAASPTRWFYRHAKRQSGKRTAEPRFDALWLALLAPIGIIIDGVCISHSKTSSWVEIAFGLGITCFGLQVAGTVTYTYCTDTSHKALK